MYRSDGDEAPKISRRRTVGKWPDKAASALAVADNDDLLAQILVRLPAKSIVRSKQVSKRWLSFISDPQFYLLWGKPKSISGIFLRRLSLSATPEYDYISLNDRNPCNSTPFTSFDFVDDPWGIDVLQSCNGLMLCSSFRLRIHSWKYYIYNPTTHQFTSLTRPVRADDRIVRGVNLAFDPSKSRHYKVICVCSHSVLLNGFYWIQVYSSETCTWKFYDDVVLAPSDVIFDKGVFWSGSIIWLSRQSEGSICFEVDQESVKTIPMPPIGEGENERTIGYFGESQGHLHLIVFCGGHMNQLDIFEMEPYCYTWSLKYRAIPFQGYRFSVLCFLCGEIEGGSSLLIYTSGKVMCYNLKDKCIKLADVKEHGILLSPTGDLKWAVGHQYVESLCSV